MSVHQRSDIHGETAVATETTNDLTLYYTFETNANPVPDMSGNNNTGTVNGATWTTNGHIQGAYDFDGSNDYIETDIIPTMGSNTDKTVAMWIYARSRISSKRMLTKNKNSSSLGFAVCYGNNPTNILALFNDGTEMRQLIPNVPTNSWQHIAAVYNESGASVTCYLNGTLVSGSEGSGWNFDANDKLDIGGRPGASQFFDGLIDQVAIYNRALSSNQIYYLYLYNGTNFPSATLNVCADATFARGVKYVAPFSDIGMGSYTNNQ